MFSPFILLCQIWKVCWTISKQIFSKKIFIRCTMQNTSIQSRGIPAILAFNHIWYSRAIFQMITSVKLNVSNMYFLIFCVWEFSLVLLGDLTFVTYVYHLFCDLTCVLLFVTCVYHLFCDLTCVSPNSADKWPSPTR